MRGLVRRALEAFPFEVRSRRALDETLLDWDAEAEAAASRGWSTRAVVGLRSCWALLRALVTSSAREAAELPALAISARLGMFAVPLALLLVVEWVFLPDAVPRRYWPELYLARLLGPIGLFIPVAAFLTAATWRRRPLPPAGYALFALGAALFVALLVPAARWHLHSVVHDLRMFDQGLLVAAPVAMIDNGPLGALGSIGTALFRRHDPYWIAMMPVVLLAPVWAASGATAARCRSRWRLAVMAPAAVYCWLQVPFISGPFGRYRLDLMLPDFRFGLPPQATLMSALAWMCYFAVPLAVMWLAHRVSGAGSLQSPRETAR